MKEETKKVLIKLGGVLVTVIVLIPAVIAILSFFSIHELNDLLPPKPPKFDFQYEGLLEPNAPIYEVTEQLAWTNKSLLGEFQINVITADPGRKFSDSMYIEVWTSKENLVVRNEWKDWQKEKAYSINLTPSKLFEYSKVPKRVLAPNYNTGKFDIKVVDGSGNICGKTTITVKNTPWFHLTQLSDSDIAPGESITAHVRVKNLGGPSKFKVYGNLYESSYTNLFALKNVSWAPGDIWRKINWSSYETPIINKNEEFADKLHIPKDDFEAGHVYLLETFAVKHLPYLKFPDGDWLNSTENWRPRDPPHYSTIVVYHRS
jgi:hypothetical protein